jgi:hypothetical protein
MKEGGGGAGDCLADVWVSLHDWYSRKPAPSSRTISGLNGLVLGAKGPHARADAVEEAPDDRFDPARRSPPRRTPSPSLGRCSVPPWNMFSLLLLYPPRPCRGSEALAVRVLSLSSARRIAGAITDPTALLRRLTMF